MQYCLSSDAAKPCFVLSFKELLIMLDCGLSAHSVLNFLPLPPVPSTRLASLPTYTPPHLNDPLLEGVRSMYLIIGSNYSAVIMGKETIIHTLHDSCAFFILRAVLTVCSLHYCIWLNTILFMYSGK